MISFKVPATTANLGPGFDTMGLALELFNEYRVEISDELIIEGCPQEYANESNLFYQAYRLGCQHIGINDKIHLEMKANIPISRGLGSSSALIIGGLCAASFLHDHRLSDEDIIRLACRMEGHPDNAVPAFLGGLTACVMNDDYPLIIRKNPHDDYVFTVFIPDFEVKTADARKILPKEISLADAVYSSSRAIMMLEALENGNEEMLRVSADDKLHEPYRRKLILGFDELKREAIRNGAISFLISGSGSTCLAISKTDELPQRMKKYLDNLKVNWQCFNLKAYNKQVTAL
ncbi:MAG: homoserine kinase [Erysipelotrichaceae bacterium]|nr:homoserine kinase [Erysipelotrichaceae bacterium]